MLSELIQFHSTAMSAFSSRAFARLVRMIRLGALHYLWQIIDIRRNPNVRHAINRNWSILKNNSRKYSSLNEFNKTL